MMQLTDIHGAYDGPMRHDVDEVLKEWAYVHGVPLAEVRKLAHWAFDMGYADGEVDTREEIRNMGR